MKTKDKTNQEGFKSTWNNPNLVVPKCNEDDVSDPVLLKVYNKEESQPSIGFMRGFKHLVAVRLVNTPSSEWEWICCSSGEEIERKEVCGWIYYPKEFYEDLLEI